MLLVTKDAGLQMFLFVGWKMFIVVVLVKSCWYSFYKRGQRIKSKMLFVPFRLI